jgi:hypothetical protein
VYQFDEQPVRMEEWGARERKAFKKKYLVKRET